MLMSKLVLLSCAIHAGAVRNAADDTIHQIAIRKATQLLSETGSVATNTDVMQMLNLLTLLSKEGAGWSNLTEVTNMTQSMVDNIVTTIKSHHASTITEVKTRRDTVQADYNASVQAKTTAEGAAEAENSCYEKEAVEAQTFATNEGHAEHHGTLEDDLLSAFTNHGKVTIDFDYRAGEDYECTSETGENKCVTTGTKLFTQNQTLQDQLDRYLGDIAQQIRNYTYQLSRQASDHADSVHGTATGDYSGKIAECKGLALDFEQDVCNFHIAAQKSADSWDAWQDVQDQVNGGGTSYSSSDRETEYAKIMEVDCLLSELAKQDAGDTASCQDKTYNLIADEGLEAFDFTISVTEAQATWPDALKFRDQDYFQVRDKNEQIYRWDNAIDIDTSAYTSLQAEPEYKHAEWLNHLTYITSCGSQSLGADN